MLPEFVLAAIFCVAIVCAMAFFNEGLKLLQDNN